MTKSALLGIVLFGVLSVGGRLVLNEAYAHCDTMGGPVVKDAQMAFDKKDVTPVLKWVMKEKEPEVRAAFETALTERVKGPEAQEKADMKFIETIVRIHRAGEGAPFSGMKPASAIEPIELKADQVLETGSADELTSKMSEHLTHGVKERFDRVLEKKKHMDDSVEAGREYVEAYVEYLHYVEGIHKSIAGKGAHQHEEAEKAEHESHDSK